MSGPLCAFLDESYGQDHYYMAAVVVDDGQYRALCTGLDAVVRHAEERFGVPKETELHAHRIMQGRQPWECFRGQVSEAVALYRGAARVVRDSGARLLVEGVDVLRLRRRYSYPHPPYVITLRHLLERIDELVDSEGYDSCSVVADLVDKERDVREVIERYTREGTPGYRSSHLKGIAQPITWLDSTEDRAIQAADLLVYMYRRVHEPDPGTSSRSTRAARAILRDFGLLFHERKWRP